MPRPGQIEPRAALTGAEIKAAHYEGSSEHKVKRWWGGLPGAGRRPAGQLTTPCLKTTKADQDEASDWVRHALGAGQFRFYEGDGTYPKHLWYKDDSGHYWFGFAINQVAGSYKGWPIDEEEKRATFDRVV